MILRNARCNNEDSIIKGKGKVQRRLTAVGTRCADHVTPLYPQKLALTSPTGGGRSVGVVRVPTKAPEFFLKVKFTPEQATKAQRGSRGIALLFL